MFVLAQVMHLVESNSTKKTCDTSTCEIAGKNVNSTIVAILN